MFWVKWCQTLCVLDTYILKCYFVLLFFVSCVGFRVFSTDPVPTLPAFLPGLHASNPGG